MEFHKTSHVALSPHALRLIEFGLYWSVMTGSLLQEAKELFTYNSASKWSDFHKTSHVALSLHALLTMSGCDQSAMKGTSFLGPQY